MDKSGYKKRQDNYLGHITKIIGNKYVPDISDDEADKIIQRSIKVLEVRGGYYFNKSPKVGLAMALKDLVNTHFYLDMINISKGCGCDFMGAWDAEPLTGNRQMLYDRNMNEEIRDDDNAESITGYRGCFNLHSRVDLMRTKLQERGK